MKRVKALLSRLPAFVRKDGAHLALVFGAAFVATDQPLLPSLIHSPDFGTAKAALASLVIVGFKAGLRAAQPVFVQAMVSLAFKIVAAQEAAQKPTEAPAPVLAPEPAPSQIVTGA